LNNRHAQFVVFGAQLFLQPRLKLHREHNISKFLELSHSKSFLQSPFRALHLDYYSSNRRTHIIFKVTMSQHTSCYMFRPSMAHHQGVLKCTKELL